MSSVFIEAIGIAGPGIAGWQGLRTVLRRELPFNLQPLAPHTPMLLPANERRRASPTVRIAFQAAEDALQSTPLSPATLATVFASSDADLNIIHRIASALTATPRMISPTDFHNSVHNAAAGYWSIAVGSRAPSTSISAFDGSFAVGLREACTTVRAEGVATLLVAFDLPPPEPLLSKRPISQPFAVALILTGAATERSLASIQCEQRPADVTSIKDAGLEALRTANPAARALPLLEHVAFGTTGAIALPLDERSTLLVDVRSR